MNANYPQISAASVDGIPTFWADVPGPFRVALMFRVGRVDETLVTYRTTHLVEHLASFRLGQQSYSHNAFVDDTTTVFHAEGTRAEAMSFLEQVVGALEALPLERLEIERDILRSESDQRDPSVGDALRAYRYGPQGFGLVGYDEFGLDWVGPDEVGRWAAERFTRDNATLWMSGEPPADLRLPLRSGSRLPVPAPAVVRDVPFPSQALGPSGGVAVGATGRRSAELSMALYIADRRLRQRLRYEQGLVYDVLANHEPLTADEAEIALAAECRDDRAVGVRDALLEVLRDLSADGPSDDELAYEVDQFERQFLDPEFTLALLDMAAHGELLGRRGDTVEELRGRRRAATRESVAATVRSALETVLIIAPEGVEPPPGTPRYPEGSTRVVDGVEFRPPGLSLPGRGPKHRLIVGEEGVTLSKGDDRFATVLFRDCRAAVHAADDRRVLWGADGLRIVVDGPEWRDGGRAIQLIDRGVPETVVICTDHGLGRGRVRQPGAPTPAEA